MKCPPMKCPHCGKTIICCENCKYWDDDEYADDFGLCTNKKVRIIETHAMFSCAKGEYKE